MRKDGLTDEQIKRSAAARSFGILDGPGIMFVSNTGVICPAGFLPFSAGNVRQDHVVDIYMDSTTFRSLHDPPHFEGRCGACEYLALCGGSRARAVEATGELLASDPFCTFEPQR